METSALLLSAAALAASYYLLGRVGMLLKRVEELESEVDWLALRVDRLSSE